MAHQMLPQNAIHSTAEQIERHPMNCSQSKFMHAFPKTKRFAKTTKGNCTQTCYNLPSQLSRRMASFGYGKKSDFTKRECNPAPNVYEKPSFVVKNKAKSKGKSFGVSRKAMGNNKWFLKAKTPGPGQYETNRDEMSKIKYSMRKKCVNIYDYTTVHGNPGPGSYSEAHQIKSNGKYFVGKYKNSGCRLIAPARSKRFKKKVRGFGNPGPGHYDKQRATSISTKGSYYLSKLKNSGATFFNKQKRNLMGFKPNVTPGPGTYRLPSDFGYYETVKPSTMKFNRARIQSAPLWKKNGSRSGKSTRRSNKRSRSKRPRSRPRTSNTVRRQNQTSHPGVIYREQTSKDTEHILK